MPKWRGTGYYYSRFRPGLVVSTTIVSWRAASWTSRVTDGVGVLGDFDKRAAISRAEDELHAGS